MCIDINVVLEKCEEYKPLPGYYFCVMSNPDAFNNIENSELKELIVERLKKNGNVLYVGSATDVKARSFIHVLGNASNSTLRYSLSAIFKIYDNRMMNEWMASNAKLLFMVCETKKEAVLIEDEYIKKLMPPLNLNLKKINPRIKKIMAELRKQNKQKKQKKDTKK